MIYNDVNAPQGRYPESLSLRRAIVDCTHDDRLRDDSPPIRSESVNRQELCHEPNEREEIPNGVPRSLSHNPQEPYATHIDASTSHPRMNLTLRRTYENAAERISQPWQRADTYASFYHHREQEPHRHHFNQHAHAHNSYSLDHQSAFVTNDARSDVPQPTSYAGAYGYPKGSFSSNKDMRSSEHWHAYDNHATDTHPPADMAPAWHPYSGMTRPYDVPPHYQQYPPSDHVSSHTDHHSHLGMSNHDQMTHLGDNRSMQPQMYSAHANHGNFARENRENYQGGNHSLQNRSNPSSHCILLATAEDTNWLSDFLCFVRLHCIETYCASHHDVSSRLGCKQVNLGQVGIRCRYCANRPQRRRVRRSSTFPSSLCRIYQSLTMMLRDHFSKCPHMPQKHKDEFDRLRKCLTQGTVGSKGYWVESAKGLGLIDTPKGIFFEDGRRAPGTM
mmetsp:Transcript_41722/g.61073  ORF Transcript_41722/g.61073 Transcript_41722/m.61073 type:complete len:446 (-) Transcript_41722:319-1656(-)